MDHNIVMWLQSCIIVSVLKCSCFKWYNKYMEALQWRVDSHYTSVYTRVKAEYTSWSVRIE